MRLLEAALALIISVSVLLSAQMLVDVPDRDIPDVKDISFLFPSIN